MLPRCLLRLMVSDPAGKGETFAWPVVPEMTALFLAAGFILRSYFGYHLLNVRIAWTHRTYHGCNNFQPYPLIVWSCFMAWIDFWRGQ